MFFSQPKNRLESSIRKLKSHFVSRYGVQCESKIICDTAKLRFEAKVCLPYVPQSRGSLNLSLVCATTLTQDDLCKDPAAEGSKTSSGKNGSLGQDEKKDKTPAGNTSAGEGGVAVVVVLLLLLVGAVIGYAVFYKKRAATEEHSKVG